MYLEKLNDSSAVLQMLLRNLKILSGMKWNICGLLLILPALFSISAEGKKNCKEGNHGHVCSPVMRENKQNQDGTDMEMDMFILGDDGFMGYIEAGKCINGKWDPKASQSTILCNSSGSLVTPKPINMTVFSYEENTAYTESLFNNSDYGVILSRYSPYNLSINRAVIPTFVCLIEGNCTNITLNTWINQGCNWTNKTTEYFEYKSEDNSKKSCQMTCLNVIRLCEISEYDPSCSDENSGDEDKINKLGIFNKTATCYKCGSPFQVVETIPLPDELSKQFNANETETDAETAAGAMKNLSSLLSFMGNLTIASVSMGNVKGVLKKIQSESKITTSYFIYSSTTGIRVLDDVAVLEKYPNAFGIPAEAANKALNQSAGSAFMGVFRFPNMSKDAENSTVLNDEVYAIEMGTKISNLSDPISLTFKYQETKETPVCHSWDGSGNKPNWTTEGCNTTKGGTNVTCQCNHLTFFAVLMISPDITISESDLTALTYITYIGCGLSLFFLSIGLFMHFLMRRVKATDSIRVLINLFVALFLLNVAFLSNEYVARMKDVNACKIMAGFMHYCLLASFNWFAVEAFHLCLQMAKHSVTIKHYMIKISVAGWAPPALVVSIIYVLGKYGEQTIKTETSNVTMCWILDSNIHYYVNIGYYCLIFIFTFSTFVVVLRWLSMLKFSKLNKAGKVKLSGTDTTDITTILGLCCMLGLTWSFAFFSYGAMRLPSYYIFTILNSFQGFFLFIYYLKASTLFGDSAPSEESVTTEETVTENPYEDLATEDTKKII
ncbi:adhesion G-protein coupled receptor G2-like [Carassius auratus]|uniref:Adhesion G-protein coupled receptor G2-like n=1 Tax=Carassius auratus TaxID=7957 RepID=A0A6P6PCS1_CARAU|nr:adhesion G-protein coupled receptor G2-like [Carassius auratus]